MKRDVAGDTCGVFGYDARILIGERAEAFKMEPAIGLEPMTC